ncbi:MAG TPA: helix-turn-helix transcriptional regulator [Micromonosporaceae bacterium]|nr:helix-turn-helix transcriptional regulator [Micromonosporaceae bacterium]
MSAPHGRTAGRFRLRSELRQRREDAGLTQEQAAAEMEWSLSKLVRIEAGTVSISVNDLRALLGLYGVHDRAEIDEMLKLARSARQRVWWTQYRDVLAPQYLEFIGFETDASGIRCFHPTIVPGLLQTEAYARAVIAGAALNEVADDIVEARVAVRMTRIKELFGRDDPPRISVVMDEAVLHRPVGGPAVMRGQLHHLAEVATQPQVDLCVLPFRAGVHPGVYGSFLLFDFPDAADEIVLYLEQAQTQMLLRDRPAEIAAYERVFNRLRAMTLSTEESIAMLLRTAGEMSRLAA